MMSEKASDEKKCFEYLCSLFPKCAAAVSCCAIDDFYDEESVVRKEQCFDLEEKPFYTEKKTSGFKRYG